MTIKDSQFFDSYVPVYDAIPPTWEEGRIFLVERLKEHANAINIRVIGWILDQELISGYQFTPGINMSGTNEQARTVLRIYIDTGALIVGLNTVAHPLIFDSNFTLIDMWVSGTNSATLKARRITGNDVILNQNTISITSPAVFDRSVCVIEYTQEL